MEETNQGRTFFINGLIAHFLQRYYNYDTDTFVTSEEADKYYQADITGRVLTSRPFPYVGNAEEQFSNPIFKADELADNPLELIFANLKAARLLDGEGRIRELALLRGQELLGDNFNANDFNVVLRLEQEYIRGEVLPKMITSYEARQLVDNQELQRRFQETSAIENPESLSDEEYNKQFYPYFDGTWYYFDLEDFLEGNSPLRSKAQRYYLVTKVASWYINSGLALEAINQEYKQLVAEEPRKLSPERPPSLPPKEKEEAVPDEPEPEPEPEPVVAPTPTPAPAPKRATGGFVRTKARRKATQPAVTPAREPTVSRAEQEREKTLRIWADETVKNVVKKLMVVCEKKKEKLQINIEQSIWITRNNKKVRRYELTPDAKTEKDMFYMNTGNLAKSSTTDTGKIHEEIDARAYTGENGTRIKVSFNANDASVVFTDLGGPTQSSRSSTAAKKNFIKTRVLQRAFDNFVRQCKFQVQSVEGFVDEPVEERLELLEEFGEEFEPSIGKEPIDRPGVTGATLGFLSEVILRLPELPMFEDVDVGGELPEIRRQRPVVAEAVRILEADDRVQDLETIIANLDTLRREMGVEDSVIAKVRGEQLQVQEVDVERTDQPFELGIPKDPQKRYISVDIRGLEPEIIIEEGGEEDLD